MKYRGITLIIVGILGVLITTNGSDDDWYLGVLATLCVLAGTIMVIKDNA